jgi:hydrogenase maturation protein HypF
MTADSETGSGFITLGTAELVHDLARRKLDGEDIGLLAYDFHRALSELIRISCIELRERTKLDTVTLSGGVFQNRLLVQLTKAALEKAGFKVLLHSVIPPNDGGICVGQAAYGALKEL